MTTAHPMRTGKFEFIARGPAASIARSGRTAAIPVPGGR
jgi:hypothetical protein